MNVKDLEMHSVRYYVVMITSAILLFWGSLNTWTFSPSLEWAG